MFPTVKAAIDRLSMTMYEQLGEITEAPPVLTFDKNARLLAGLMIGGAVDELIRQLFQIGNSEPAPVFSDTI